MTDGKFDIAFGFMSDSIRVQLCNQGLGLDTENLADIYQRCADGLSQCYLNGFLPRSQVRAAEQKMMKDIAKHVVPIGETL